MRELGIMLEIGQGLPSRFQIGIHAEMARDIEMSLLLMKSKSYRVPGWRTRTHAWAKGQQECDREKDRKNFSHEVYCMGIKSGQRNNLFRVYLPCWYR